MNDVESKNSLNKPIKKIQSIQKVSAMNAQPKISIKRINPVSKYESMTRNDAIEEAPACCSSCCGGNSTIPLTTSVKSEPSKSSTQSSVRQILLFGCAIILALAAEFADWVQWSVVIEVLCAFSAMMLVGLKTYQKGFLAIKNADLNMNALMSIAVTGAFAIGQWPEAAMVMVLFALAEKLEAFSVHRARDAISGLLALAPKTARFIQADDVEVVVDVLQLKPRDIIRIRVGESIPIDGEIIAGQTTVNQASMTGESLPIEKEIGDIVYAGTLNTSGLIDIRVTAVASETKLAKIIQLVDQAQMKKAPIQRTIDQFAKFYTPCVVILALLMAIIPPLFLHEAWGPWIYKACVALVVACPCALVISTPVTIVSALSAAARHGLLIKGGLYLELARRLRWVAFDKTGTLTTGQPTVKAVHYFSPSDPDSVVQIAASLANTSNHPLSQAIIKFASQRQVGFLPVMQNSETAGRGVSGEIKATRYHLGSIYWLRSCGYLSTDEVDVMLNQSDGSLVLLASENLIIAAFEMVDEIRDVTKETINRLHQSGVQTVILSGDQARAVQQVAESLGVTAAFGQLLPEDKLVQLNQYRAKGLIAMIGDGINDAPALANADIGIAMGGMGSDTAIETADVTFMNDDLRHLPYLIQLSRRTHRILIQNIAIALGVKIGFLAMTFIGVGSLWLAVFADVGTSLIVIANGLRMLKKSKVE